MPPTVDPGGLDAKNGEPVGFRQDRPLVARLTFDDGTVMDVEIPLGTVERLKQINPQDNNPIYKIGVAPIVMRFVKVPEELRKKGYPWMGGR